MQSDKVIIACEADGFTIMVDESYYRFSHDMDEIDYSCLKAAIEHITSGTVRVEVEEVY